MKLGQTLLKAGLINQEQLDEALRIQKKSGGKIGDILFFNENLRPLDYFKSLADYFKLDFVDFKKVSNDPTLLIEIDRQLYLDKQMLPYQKKAGSFIIATADPSIKNFNFIKQKWGEDTQIVVTSKFDILWAMSAKFGEDYLDESINDLLVNHEEFSSKKTVTFFQKCFLLILFVFMVIAFYLWPYETAFFTNAFFTFLVSILLVFRLFLGVTALFIRNKDLRPERLVSDEELPVYTILVPMYMEKDFTIRDLVYHLKKLDYPHHKLDIKLILEEDDQQTIAAIRDLQPPSYFEVIIVPDGEPKTKPKACNYALKFAKGEYVTIYDAEDHPDPDQPRAVYSYFKEQEEKGDDKLACIQCYLNYWNANENWLTIMFSLEYTYWYQLMLPTLNALKLPIPLGGTSNHFKTSVLQELSAWDPYNVTEDADLGIRIAHLGYRTSLLASMTNEEANCRFVNWIKQRTRWIKGYMVTMLVHNRKPLEGMKLLGFRNFLSFNAFIGGSVLVSLGYIIFFFIFIATWLTESVLETVIYPDYILYFSWFNFIFGTFGIIILTMLGVFKTKDKSLILYALSAPLYWFMIGISAFRAFFQLIFQPSKWEKTEHGISNQIAHFENKMDHEENIEKKDH